MARALPTPPAVDEAAFRSAMRRTAAGVAVITTDGVGGRAGLTVSSFTSVSMEPPSVMFCVHQNARSYDTIVRNGTFVANILSGEQEEVAKVFAGMVPHLRDDKFSAHGWSPIEGTAPALEGALSNIACTVAHVCEFGSHAIVVGAVTAVRENEARPLVFSDRAFHRLPV
ncbi:flavin reductase family protein [Acuticoccus mangrovi]|uniref:Flavin reductase n=1 Tax=Acuticoccus mangrovi TaxID=2796142 RepID=A0A934MFR3_9HYPH|nr:flavin reductase family protein [Acuticoccus mangrovi]MBJ3775753.1 flavin reductase [Acuticoccus mangrovi]